MQKKLYLELIRGIASILVLITHLVILHPRLNSLGLNAFSNWGTESVMIFFILSGAVINISQKNNPKSSNQFLLNRIIRIYPQFFIGIMISLIVFVLLQLNLPPVKQIAGNLFMMSSLNCYWVCSIITNTPVWSLTYEMGFYLLFFLILKFKLNIRIWLWISIVCLPLFYLYHFKDDFFQIISIFSFSLIWLIGYYIVEYKSFLHFEKKSAIISLALLPLISRLHLSDVYYDPAKYLLFAIVAIPFFHYCLQEKNNGKKISIFYIVLIYFISTILLIFTSESLVLNKVVYALLPLITLLLNFMSNYFSVLLKIKYFVTNKFAFVSGKYSYSIYIIHFPVLFYLGKSITNPLLYVFLGLLIVLIFSK